MAGCSLPEKADWIEGISRAGNEKEMQKLITNGFNVNTQDSGGNTPLHYACGWGLNDSERQAKKLNMFFPAGLEEHSEFVVFLLKNRANPNIQNNYGETPIKACIYHGRAATIKYLLAYGAKVDVIDKYGSTALTLALNFCDYFDYSDIIQMLLDAGANAKKIPNDDITVTDCLKKYPASRGL